MQKSCAEMNEDTAELKTSELYFVLDEVCYRYKVFDQDILDLNSQHEEYDT